MLRQKVLVLLLGITLVGAGCGQKTPEPPAPAATPVTLNMWELFDEPEVYTRLIEKYREAHPNVTINVTKKDYPTYEFETSNGIAAGTGPDIWMIRNDWLPRHADKLEAMPEGLLAQNQEDKKGSNAELLKELYASAVTTDAIATEQVYGIPLSIDTLALYYNKDHFAQAGISQPPATWSEFIAAVEKLTQFEDAARTKIKRAGASLGTAANINRASDILTLLLLQNGTPMVSEDQKSALFNGGITKESGGIVYPGTNALEFYTGFADPKKKVFSWDKNQQNSIDAFVFGKSSMFFSYAYMEQTLLQRAPALKYGVAPMPQVDNAPEPIDYPTYWLYVVSRNSAHSAEAWDLIRFMSAEGDVLYQESTGKPPAKKQTAIPAVAERAAAAAEAGNPWKIQVNSATTWYRGKNPAEIEKILLEMIDNVVSFGQSSQTSIDNGAVQATKSLSRTT